MPKDPMVTELRNTLRDIKLMIEDYRKCQDKDSLLDLCHDIHGITKYCIDKVEGNEPGEA